MKQKRKAAKNRCKLRSSREKKDATGRNGRKKKERKQGIKVRKVKEKTVNKQR